MIYYSVCALTSGTLHAFASSSLPLYLVEANLAVGSIALALTVHSIAFPYIEKAAQSLTKSMLLDIGMVAVIFTGMHTIFGISSIYLVASFFLYAAFATKDEAINRYERSLNELITALCRPIFYCLSYVSNREWTEWLVTKSVAYALPCALPLSLTVTVPVVILYELGKWVWMQRT